MQSTKQNEFVRLTKRFREFLAEGNVKKLASRGVDKALVYSQYGLRKQQFSGKTFRVFDVELPYFIHHYNATWRNERCIEIALANHYLKMWRGPKILELGNVMSYYEDHNYTVVDKYEQSPGIINEDFVEFESSPKHDAFISISTFEHIGWDEAEKSKDKLEQCFNNIVNQVKDKSKVLVTVPLGYNRFLDELASDDKLPFARLCYLVRTSADQQWKSVDLEEALDPRYAYEKKYDGANSLLIGVGLR